MRCRRACCGSAVVYYSSTVFSKICGEWRVLYVQNTCRLFPDSVHKALAREYCAIIWPEVAEQSIQRLVTARVQ